MLKLLIYIALIYFANFGHSQNLPAFYQIDLILFAHSDYSMSQQVNTYPILPHNRNMIILQAGDETSSEPYHLLPFSSSKLQKEYRNLQNAIQYKILSRYTWRQFVDNKQYVMLPKTIKDGGEIQGVVQVKHSNYYLLNAELAIAMPDKKAAFNLKINQRLRGEQLYYLDDPRVGMLIKIHQLI